MTAPSEHVLVKAGREFDKDESKRRMRPRFTPAEQTELRLHLGLLGRHIEGPNGWAQRGDLAVGLFGYTDTFEEQAATVIADIMWAINARGGDPLHAIAQARAYYYEDRERTPQQPLPGEDSTVEAELIEEEQDD